MLMLASYIYVCPYMMSVRVSEDDRKRAWMQRRVHESYARAGDANASHLSCGRERFGLLLRMLAGCTVEGKLSSLCFMFGKEISCVNDPGFYDLFVFSFQSHFLDRFQKNNSFLCIKERAHSRNTLRRGETFSKDCPFKLYAQRINFIFFFLQTDEVKDPVWKSV